MNFLVKHSTSFGDRVVLVGSTQTLGKWKVPAGIYCTWQEGDIWQADLPNIPYPTRFEFKYAILTSTGTHTWEQGPNHCVNLPANTSTTQTVRWGAGQDYVISPHENDAPSPPPTPAASKSPPASLAVAAARVATGQMHELLTFRIQYKLQPGETIYVLGSVPELGEWDKMHSPMLRASGKHLYELSVPIPHDKQHEVFEYKYFTRRADGSRRWEQGENRIVKPFLDNSPRDLYDGHLLLDDRWEKIRFEFSIYYPTKPEQVMHVTGDPAEIGDWCRPGPTPMSLGPIQLLETDVKGRKWYLSVWTARDLQPFSYRYILIDEVSKQELWEREPNRRAEFGKENVVNGVHVLRDVNFVSKMHFDRVPPNMFIGPYPQTAADVDAMAEQGVTGVFNVQTDEDFKHRGIQWAVLKERYDAHGILVVRHPIRDFDRESLRERLHGATHALDDMLKKGREVYIHCTAGMGRAPACAVSYLCWVKGMELEAAVTHVKKHRRVAVPNVPVLEQALKERY